MIQVLVWLKTKLSIVDVINNGIGKEIKVKKQKDEVQ